MRHNQEDLDHAKRAIAVLKAAWPEVDWRPVEEPHVDLRPRGLLARLLGRR